MKKTAEHPHCLTAGTAPGLVDNFKRNNEILEGIAKGLETFLEVDATVLSKHLRSERLRSMSTIPGTHVAHHGDVHCFISVFVDRGVANAVNVVFGLMFSNHQKRVEEYLTRWGQLRK